MRHLITAVVIIAFACSCKKEKKANENTYTNTVTTFDQYLAFKPGNYWIYQGYGLDSANGAAYPNGRFDSTYVEKDTVINALTYHKYCNAELFSSGQG